MIQIQRHIEILLLSHDCVIVPGFGGFIAHHVDARYDEDDRLWLPPYRTLGFNPQLTLNDSLLVQSYVEAYDMSYPDALRQIEAEVEELKSILHTEGEYEMDGVGTLSVNIEGNVEFEPCEAGILSPEIYGLSDFNFKRLKDADSKEVVQSEGRSVALNKEVKGVKEVREEKESEEPTPALLDFAMDDDDADNQHNAIVIKMSWIRNAVAIAAAVACFFLLATPITNSNLGNTAMSQLQGNIIYKLMPKDSNMTPAEPVVKEAKEVKEVKEVKEIQEENKDTYCIVLASQVKRSNAEEYVSQLQKRGISDARINVEKGTIRVICGKYDNQSQAYNHLNKMAMNIEFADAWVYKLKEV